uniref:VSH-1 tail protein n=1 Tax=Brachyspira intermedia TaxID=84377 RepID=B9USE0_9SPIR|nr:VSH-1 tail protein [Brachyspira intermedia]
MKETIIEHFYLEKDGITYTEKTPEMKLKDGLITIEEYNNIQNQKRETLYESKTDKQVLELTRAFLNRNIDNLTEEEKLILDSINKEVEEIKTQYPKQN